MDFTDGGMRGGISEEVTIIKVGGIIIEESMTTTGMESWNA
jgi:hypothetical protein